MPVGPARGNDRPSLRAATRAPEARCPDRGDGSRSACPDGRRAPSGPSGAPPTTSRWPMAASTCSAWHGDHVELRARSDCPDRGAAPVALVPRHVRPQEGRLRAPLGWACHRHSRRGQGAMKNEAPATLRRADRPPRGRGHGTRPTAHQKQPAHCEDRCPHPE